MQDLTPFSGSAFERLTKVLGDKRVWLLLDEWSVVPLDLQPYLADLVRRAIFPAKSITVKIAAIERRSRFQKHIDGTEYIGIELGGDASADLNMDDFMVFDNNEEKAVTFFRSLIYRHVKTLAEEEGIDIPNSPSNSSILRLLKRASFKSLFEQLKESHVMHSTFCL